MSRGKQYHVDVQLLSELYKKHQSASIVGDILGVSKSIILRNLKENNIPIRKNKNDVNHSYFKYDTPEVFYWAGFMAADGCVQNPHDKRFSVSLSLSSTDHGHVQKFKETIGFGGPISVSMVKGKWKDPNNHSLGKYKDSQKSEISFLSKEMFDDLARFNIVPKKSLIYTFPEFVINHKYKNHFMRGYFDGDGSFFFVKSKNHKTGKEKPTIQKYFSLRGTVDFLTVYRNILETECVLPVRTNPIRFNKTGILDYGGNGVLAKIEQFLFQNATVYLDRKWIKNITEKSLVEQILLDENIKNNN